MRLVIKIGTSNLCDADGRLNEDRLASLAQQLGKLFRDGHQLIVVSSGAVGAGIGRVGREPRTIQEKRALAAIGQVELIHHYKRYLGEIIPAQILLIRDDLEAPSRRRKSARTLEQLVAWGILPIINENDSVADEEIRIGDNDTLAARVACLVGADLLVLLSDVDGLYTADPRRDPSARRIDRVDWVTAAEAEAAEQGGGPFGTGGMATKLAAVRLCQDEGIPTVLADGKAPAVLDAIVGRHAVGTWFLAKRGEAVTQ